MTVLGIDTSAPAASAAVCTVGDEPRVIAFGSVNNKLTHSRTLIPFIEAILTNSGTELSDIDVFAVSAGPGSFTGLRIGVSAVKGMAYALGKPCKAVSTLHALAYALQSADCIACPVMDARCDQVYNALFEINGGRITRLCEDRALFIPELEAQLKAEYAGRTVILVGDGAQLCYRKFGGGNIRIAPPQDRFENAACVCFASQELEEVSAAALMPKYLRLPQAERERQKKLAENKS